jgi:predicted nucleic acid-binding protein
LTLFVLDASVAVKWFLLSAEPLKAEAVALLARRMEGEIEFIVPDLFWAELGNILWKATRQARCTAPQAEGFLDRARGQDLPTVPSEELLNEALAIASEYSRSFYDGLYLALAVTEKIEMITADERLANAVSSHLPVKWLGYL